MAFENNRCFAWCVRLKQSCNERWARFRNRFRRRFYSSRGQSLDQSTVLNETGTPDMVLHKIPLMANKVAPITAQETAVEESPAVNSVPTTGADKVFEKFVEDYVSSVISKAAGTLISQRKPQTPDNGSAISADDNGRVISADDNGRVISADDNVSLTSSIISQIADSAVTESLTNIVTENDTNHSAANGDRPRTVKEFMEMFGMATLERADDGLTPISC